MYYGDLGKRIVASILDSIFTFAISCLFVFLVPIVGWIIATVAVFLYYILMEGSDWHATLGKKIMGLYIGYDDAIGITYTTAILRTIAKPFSGLFLCVGYLMCLFNNTKQCLHDMIAKTYVYSEEALAMRPSRMLPRNDPRVGGRSRGGQNYGASAYAEIVGVTGPLAGTVYPVDDRGVLIGRDSVSCQIVIPESQNKVSRTHCFVTYNSMSRMFVVNDRNSTHGTYLANGTRVSYAQPAALKSGDRFYLATKENTFEVR